MTLDVTSPCIFRHSTTTAPNIVGFRDTGLAGCPHSAMEDIGDQWASGIPPKHAGLIPSLEDPKTSKLGCPVADISISSCFGLNVTGWAIGTRASQDLDAVWNADRGSSRLVCLTSELPVSLRDQGNSQPLAVPETPLSPPSAMR
ncbi:uncharacterized protein BDZ83DRAFT_647233 [Colletotrichum acutatum]|uniref:Uncharacterized protein n=1 Tax=Glomerella acutata TaxID=27357 RepID=A0AAD9D0V1_GLOAC|nr:uncharacterized protein BDZ83DRAFT_647233 [Colletotrichum acutatum]KAK1730057.1 hypothetical protein BDZ83DRAFT_647233 [Colletotrichum acutatum]